jgi:hypothetical protein
LQCRGLSPETEHDRDAHFEAWLMTSSLPLVDINRERVAEIDRQLGLKLDGSPLAATTASRLRIVSRACIEGALSSAAPYVAVMDADLQHDEAILPAMVAKLQNDEADLVIGSRFVGDGSSEGGFSARRAFASRVATRLAAFIIGLAIWLRYNSRAATLARRQRRERDVSPK